MAGTELIKPSEYAALAMPPEDLKAIVEENLAGQQIGEFDLDRIKMPAGGGKTWEVPTLEGEIATPELQGVIVYWKESRAFWKEAFSGGSDAPDCSADDAQFATGEPGVAVPTDESGRYICAQCPNAQFGTAINEKGEQGPGQACKLTRQLFLLTPQSLIPLVVSLPPTSVKAAKTYMLRLASGGIRYNQVITKISLKVEQSQGGIKYSQAQFEMGGRLEGDEADRIREFADRLRPSFERVAVVAEDLRAEGGVEL